MMCTMHKVILQVNVILLGFFSDTDPHFFGLLINMF